MPTRKSKKIVKKPVRRVTKRVKSKPVRTRQSRTVSFFIGIVTVLAIAFVLFQYVQGNNYKQVLGKKTEIFKQTPKIK